MNTKRQTELFLSLYSSKNQLMKLKDLAKKLDVSVRTVQNDLNSIKEEWKANGILFYSVPSKGCGIKIDNKKKAALYLKQLQDETAVHPYFDDQQFRVTYLLKVLLENREYIKSQNLADQMFLSKSRLSDDMKIVRERLTAYDLQLISKPSYGLKIVGTEKEKRYCLIKESVTFNHEYGLFNEIYLETINEVKDITTQILIEEQYQISDIALQNLIIHVYTSILRMKENNFVEEMDEIIDSNYVHERVLAKKIIETCCKNFDLPFKTSEVDYLTMNLAGKREYDNETYISQEISLTIYLALEEIKKIFHVDLTNDLDLRIALGLHLIPLKSRIATNMQFKNVTMYDVKQTFPFAFDVASAFVQHVFNKEYSKISEDELFYIAVHFITSLENYIANGDTKNILIVSSRKKGETVLLQQRIKKWFSDINEIAIKPTFTFSEQDLIEYNVVLTTESSLAEQHPSVRKINYFLTDEDYKKIESALNGLSGLKDIVDKFSEDLFWTGNVEDKYEIIDILVQKSDEKFQLPTNFQESILSHEKETSTYFGNKLAIIHPQTPITDETFITVGLLDQDISWISHNRANIVMLVSIEKNNPAALQLWYYLSYLISDQKILEMIRKKGSYEFLIQTVTDVYKKLF